MNVRRSNAEDVYREKTAANDIYREGTAANLARVNSSSQSGSLADVTKNATVLVPIVTVGDRGATTSASDSTTYRT